MVHRDLHTTACMNLKEEPKSRLHANQGLVVQSIGRLTKQLVKDS